MIRTDRYGTTTLVREPEVKRSMDPEARADRLKLHGPAREFAVDAMQRAPMLSDHEVERCVRGWMKSLYMEQGGAVLY